MTHQGHRPSRRRKQLTDDESDAHVHVRWLSNLIFIELEKQVQTDYLSGLGQAGVGGRERRRRVGTREIEGGKRRGGRRRRGRETGMGEIGMGETAMGEGEAGVREGDREVKGG